MQKKNVILQKIHLISIRMRIAYFFYSSDAAETERETPNR